MLRKIANRFSLPIVLTIPFIVIVIVAIGLTGYFSFQHSQAVVIGLADQLHQEITAGVQRHLENSLAIPHRINEHNLDSIRLGQLDIQDVTKTVDTGGVDPVPLGSVVTYTVEIHNGGNTLAGNVVMTDPLPSAVTFGDFVGTGGSAILPPPASMLVPPTVIWEPGDIPPDGTFSLSFTAVVTDNEDFEGTTVVNTAYVVADNDDLVTDAVSFDIEDSEFLIFLPFVVRNNP